MTALTHINQEEIKYLNLAIHDQIGRVFSWNGALYREIYPVGTEEMKEFLNSGCYEELVNKNFIPKTSITSFKTENSDLVLQHEKIALVKYPFEWSFSMMKDAALLVLEINEIAIKYGFETKDCHPYNIVFDKCQPKFIDFGSFRKRYPHQRGWRAKNDFKQSYVYLLKTWKRSGDFSARALLSYAMEGIPHYNYLRNKSLLYRLIPPNILTKASMLFHEFNLISSFPKEHVEKKFPFGLGKWANKLSDLGLLPFQRTSFRALRRKINGIKIKSAATMWSDYHNLMYLENGELQISDRFTRILEMVNELNITSVLEFAGNQGFVSKLLLKHTNVNRVVCTDYDTQAIDILYNQVKNTDLELSPVVYNFKFPISADHLPSFGERFKGHDAVFALALTHHLLLTQKMSMPWILSSVDVVKSRYLFIEFMELGLWSTRYPDKVKDIPSWYTVDWFRNSLEEKYKIIFEEDLEKNRIMFVCERLDYPQ